MVLYDRGLPALIEPGEGGSGAECLHPRPEQVARERAQRAHVRVVGHVRRIARRTGLAHLRNRHAQIYFHTVQLSILHGTERSIVCAPLIHGDDQAVLPVACDTGVLAVRRKQPIGVAPSADVGGAAPVRALQGIRVKRIMGAVGEDSLNRLPGAQRSLGRGVAVRAIDREVLEQRTLPQAVPRTALQLGTGRDNGVAANFMHGLNLFPVSAPVRVREHPVTGYPVLTVDPVIHLARTVPGGRGPRVLHRQGARMVRHSEKTADNGDHT